MATERIKKLCSLRQPPYELPADSFIDEASEYIIRAVFDSWSWIKAEDRLPPLDPSGMDEGDGISDPLIICYTCKDDPYHIYRRIGHCTKIEGKIKWGVSELFTWDILPQNNEELITVTHWMPLPNVPKEEIENE